MNRHQLTNTAMSIAIAWGVLGTAACCFPVRYLSQAASGELNILHRARPIPKAVRDPKTPERIRALLLRVPDMKSFGRAQGLKPTENYSNYADLKRSACVWVVSACDSLAFKPKRWHFPIAGTVPYLGWFHESDAEKYAETIRTKEHLDVDVRTAGAFSTLGWVQDPVLSTMIPEGDEALGELADVVLHESLHATIYIKNQSNFDESLASFVGDRLAGEWLDANGGPNAPETIAWNAQESFYTTHVARMHAAYEALDALYNSSRTDDEKRAEKKRVLDALGAEVGARRPITNATLVGYRTYDTGGPAFDRLLTACDGSMPRFLAALKTVKESDFATPQQDDFDPIVQPRIDAGCR